MFGGPALRPAAQPPGPSRRRRQGGGGLYTKRLPAQDAGASGDMMRASGQKAAGGAIGDHERGGL